MIDFLNLGSDEKSTLAGSEFQTLTIQSAMAEIRRGKKERRNHGKNIMVCPIP